MLYYETKQIKTKQNKTKQNKTMNLSKEKIKLRHEIMCEANASMQFGSANDVLMLEIFMLKVMVQIGTSIDTRL